MSQLVLINKTSNSLSYVDSQITISPNSDTMTDFGLVPYLILDPNFKNDVLSSNLLVSDSVNIYSTQAALDFLSTWVNSGPPQNSADAVAFTLAGKGFSATGDANLSNTTETPVLLLNNPDTNSKNARALYFYAAPNSTQGIVTINIYINPTITSNGISLGIQNNLVSATSPYSVMECYGGPSCSSFGAKRITIVVNANSDSSLMNFNQTAILAPGNSMLMTVTVSNLGLLPSVDTFFFLQWVEE